MVDCPTPRALRIEEIHAIVQEFRRGARHAIVAGNDD
jgi:N-ethylmaleimide reductase